MMPAFFVHPLAAPIRRWSAMSSLVAARATCAVRPTRRVPHPMLVWMRPITTAAAAPLATRRSVHRSRSSWSPTLPSAIRPAGRLPIPARFASSQSSTGAASNRPTVLHTIDEVRKVQQRIVREGGTLGFVPTMGALHSGHVTLASRSMRENTSTLVSIFVNPTQFLAHEDLGSYPRTLDADLQALGNIGVQYVFAPSVHEMYPSWPTFLTSITMAGADSTSEGKQRPGHFAGVATVVNKLFNIVAPTRAYFGQKDGMQCVVVRRMVKDLNVSVDVRVCPTVRALDGLALSSRNVYLTPNERAVAPVIFRALTAANDLYLRGERDAAKLKQAARVLLEAQPEGRLEYVSLAAADSGAEITDGRVADVELDEQGEVKNGGAMLSVAYKLGKPRLIDNTILGQALRPGKD